MPISFPKCTGGSSNIVEDESEAGLRQSNSKQSTDPFSSEKIAAYQAAFRSLSGNGGDIVSQQFCKYGLNSA